MKFRHFVKTIPMKLYIIVAAVLLFAFFSNDFGLVDIQKTAVILAAGIDRSGEDFRLTAQLAVPKGSDRTTGGTSSVEIKTEGKTVSDCITQIFTDTGWVPKLVFCNLIVLGEEAAKEDTISYLNYFLRNEYMPDSCLLAVCEGTAEKLITSQSAIDDASSLAIAKLFSDAAEKSGYVMPNTLKDFAIGYYGVSKSSYLPYLRTMPQDGAQTPSSGTQPSPQEEEQQKIYTAKHTALFSEGRMTALLSPEETLAFSLLKGKVSAGTFNAEAEGKPVTLTLLEDEGKISLQKDPTKAKLSVSVMVRFCCSGTTAPIEEISSDEVTKETLKSAEEVLKGYLSSMWEKATEGGCDLLGLRKSLYRSSLKKYAEYKNMLPHAVTPQIEVNVASMK